MSDFVPAYRKIKDYIRLQIQSGALQKDDQIPSQIELMELFNVSRGTVHNAIDNLIKEGIIYGIHGIGNFILDIEGSKPEAIPPQQESSMKTLGFILPYDYHFTPDMMTGMEACLSENKYRLIVCNSDGQHKKEEQLIKQLIDEGINGLIMYTSFSDKKHATLTQLQQTKFPFVLVNLYISTFPCDFVVSNNVEGGYLAGKHLCELGHSSMASFLWTDYKDVATVRERLIGFRRALREHGSKMPDSNIFGCSLKQFGEIDNKLNTKKFYSPLEEPLKMALDQIKGLSAIFSINDVIALELLRCLNHLKIKVPEEISIVGFDDSPFNNHIQVPLTTIRQNFYEMGRAAAEMILSKLEDPSLPPNRLFLSTELIVRQSTFKHSGQHKLFNFSPDKPQETNL